MKKKKIKLCLTKQLLNMFKLWCECGISRSNVSFFESKKEKANEVKHTN